MFLVNLCYRFVSFHIQQQQQQQQQLKINVQIYCDIMRLLKASIGQTGTKRLLNEARKKQNK
jgi:hypothetical protein